MHPLAAKLFHENFGMLLVSKTENLVPLLLPNHGMSVPRKRQAVCSAEFLDFLVVQAGALLFNEADPVRETSPIDMTEAPHAWSVAKTSTAARASRKISPARRKLRRTYTPSSARCRLARSRSRQCKTLSTCCEPRECANRRAARRNLIPDNCEVPWPSHARFARSRMADKAETPPVFAAAAISAPIGGNANS